MDATYRPFSCGTQAEDWMSSNCDRCTKQFKDQPGRRCCIQSAIIDAWSDGGDVSAEMARRMGFLDADGATTSRYLWPCTEVEWTDGWKAEYRRRHPEESRS